MLEAFVEFLLELFAEGIVWILLFSSWLWFIIMGFSWLLYGILNYQTLLWICVGFSIWWLITLFVPLESQDSTW
ncbi:hypothetical protein [Paenibacillus albus]|uniref:Uncharacterized protein n=1 Tax=Paenibacillus albus TaxID=2495582 RepID=A0A3S9A673_9BACL|nr:hypothetical protein [Paenibacillus albus]AZN41259.1 hypothetical protein EJC50_17470 [Paenibacillus albus]